MLVFTVIVLIIFLCTVTSAIFETDLGIPSAIVLIMLFLLSSAVNAVSAGDNSEKECIETYLYNIKGVSVREELANESAKGFFLLGCGYVQGARQSEQMKYIYFAEYEGKGGILEYSNIDKTYIYETNEQAPAAYKLENVLSRKANWLDEIWGANSGDVMTFKEDGGIKLVVPEGTMKIDYNISL